MCQFLEKKVDFQQNILRSEKKDSTFANNFIFLYKVNLLCDLQSYML